MDQFVISCLQLNIMRYVLFHLTLVASRIKKKMLCVEESSTGLLWLCLLSVMSLELKRIGILFACNVFDSVNITCH